MRVLVHAVVEQHAMGSSVSVDTAGGHLTGWQVRGSQLLYSGQEDGKRRSTHFCWPNFGERDGLPKHGIVRLLPWSITGHSATSPVLTLSVRSSAKSEKLYDRDFTVSSKLVLQENKFIWEVLVVKRGSQPIAHNPGFHPYFNFSPTLRWIEETFNVDASPLEREDSIRTKNPGRLHFKLPDTGPRGWLTIESDAKDLPDLVLWTSRPGAPFFCIEPVRLPSRQLLTITPVHTWSTRLELTFSPSG